MIGTKKGRVGGWVICRHMGDMDWHAPPERSDRCRPARPRAKAKQLRPSIIGRVDPGFSRQADG